MVILAVVSSIGLPWAVLQTVAWTGMIITYSLEGTLQEALAKTFDGKHPCSLCKQIEQGRKSEKKSAFQIEGKKLECVSFRQVFVFCPPTSFCLLFASDDSVRQLPVAPLLPPPRLA